MRCWYSKQNSRALLWEFILHNIPQSQLSLGWLWKCQNLSKRNFLNFEVHFCFQLQFKDIFLIILFKVNKNSILDFVFLICYVLKYSFSYHWFLVFFEVFPLSNRDMNLSISMLQTWLGTLLPLNIIFSRFAEKKICKEVQQIFKISIFIIYSFIYLLIF